MTKRELSGRITSTFEELLEKNFQAFDFDESDGGRRTFHIDHELAERGYFQFEWSRTNQDVCSWDSMQWVNGSDEQNAAREACLKLEQETQNLFDLVIKNQTALYEASKLAK
jgi:hypothetical protein